MLRTFSAFQRSEQRIRNRFRVRPVIAFDPLQRTLFLETWTFRASAAKNDMQAWPIRPRQYRIRRPEQRHAGLFQSRRDMHGTAVVRQQRIASGQQSDQPRHIALSGQIQRLGHLASRDDLIANGPFIRRTQQPYSNIVQSS